jgi:hypothetical protein
MICDFLIGETWGGPAVPSLPRPKLCLGYGVGIMGEGAGSEVQLVQLGIIPCLVMEIAAQLLKVLRHYL